MLLLRQELKVCELMAILRISQPLVSLPTVGHDRPRKIAVQISEYPQAGIPPAQAGGKVGAEDYLFDIPVQVRTINTARAHQLSVFSGGQHLKMVSFRKNGPVLTALFLFLMTLAVFWPLTRCEFVNYDDNLIITENRSIQAGLTSDTVVWAFTTTHAANWIPLTWLSHLADIEMYGLSPRGHHLTNILFHCVNTVLVFLVLWKMTGALWRSCLVAALFSLHPLHVESVAWVTLRRDVLSTFFGLLCLGIYRFYALSPDWKKYVLLTLSFVLSLMAKPMLVTLPFALLLLDYWPLGRFGQEGTGGGEEASRQVLRTLRQLLLEKVPLFALSALFSVATYMAQQGSGAIKSAESYPAIVRLANALLSYNRYVGMTLWPDDLAVYYPHPGLSLALWKGAAAGMALIAVTVLAVRWRRSRPYLAVGWFWFLGTLVPVIGIIQTGTQSHADRYTYVPLLGLFIIAAWLPSGALTAGRYGKAALASGTIVILGVLAVLTIRQQGHWKNSIALMEQAIRVTPRNDVAHNHLGIAFQSEGRAQEAMDHYRESIRINPRHVNALYNLGRVLLLENNYRESAFYLGSALELTPQDADTLSLLGVALARLGRFDEATVHMKEGVRLDPGNIDFRRNLGKVLLRARRHEDAAIHMKDTLRFFPYDAETHSDLGTALTSLGRFQEAMPHLLEAIRINPDRITFRQNLNRARAAQERRKKTDGPDDSPPKND